MMSDEKRFREIRTYASQDDGALYVYFCFELIPQGGFICPYVERYKNSMFHNDSENTAVLRGRLFDQVANGSCPVHPTVDQAMDAFDLSKAYKP